MGGEVVDEREAGGINLAVRVGCSGILGVEVLLSKRRPLLAELVGVIFETCGLTFHRYGAEQSECLFVRCYDSALHWLVQVSAQSFFDLRDAYVFTKNPTKPLGGFLQSILFQKVSCINHFNFAEPFQLSSTAIPDATLEA